MTNYQYLFTEALSSRSQLHFAAHSHHFWPDCTHQAQDDYWRTSVRLNDEKWPLVFNQALSETRNHIARHLGLSDPRQIALAPSTHELAERLLSSYVGRKKVRVLTTTEEFHSFRRQAQRYSELPEFEVVWMPVEPYATFTDRLCEQLATENFDLAFISHVFYSSGFTLPALVKVAESTPTHTTLAIDGYHSFFALPTSLREIEDRIFFLAGGYKYAMAGEGICFMHVPKSTDLRPLNTGWFAEFERLNETPGGEVWYPANGMRFAGSTFDPLPAYRFNSVMRTLEGAHIDVPAIHRHVNELKHMFIDELGSDHALASKIIKPLGEIPPAHFLTFKTERAAELQKKLLSQGVYTDFRADRWRIGFGLYHTAQDVLRFVEIFKQVQF